MFRKILGSVVFSIVILNFAVFASDDDLNLGVVFDSRGRVENPIPTLVAKVSGESLLNLDLSESFRVVISKLKDKCSVPLSKFGTSFLEHKSDWEDKLKLLDACVISLRGAAELNYDDSKECIWELHDTLVLITNNGFFSKIKSAVTDTEYQETCLPILDETIQCLWQARELLEWTIATKEQTVDVSTLPELCDFVARGSNVVSKIIAPSSAVAQSISTYFWKVTDRYGYYESAKVVVDLEHYKEVEKILGGFEKKQIMLKPFDK